MATMLTHGGHFCFLNHQEQGGLTMERNDVLAAFQEALSTPEEIAKDLRVHKSWIYARTRETGPRSIPRVMVGKYLRFRKSEVMEWIRTRSTQE